MANVVVYTQRVEIIESYKERRNSSDQRISDFLSKCGFIPIPLPNDLNVALRIIDLVKPSGIVLTGGNSLVKYGGDAPEKDLVDKGLIQLAIQNNIPLLGFCRGMQSILDYFGNDLVKLDGHVASKHIITSIDGKCRIVNSYHSYGCVYNNSVNLCPLYYSNDGVIEMIKHNRYRLFGIMWHPERENDYCKDDIELFRTLFGGE